MPPTNRNAITLACDETHRQNVARPRTMRLLRYVASRQIERTIFQLRASAGHCLLPLPALREKYQTSSTFVVGVCLCGTAVVFLVVGRGNVRVTYPK